MKPKILFVAYHFPPEINGGVERIKNFYKNLKSLEFETYVIAPAYKNVRYEDGMDIIRYPNVNRESNFIRTGIERVKYRISVAFGRPVFFDQYWEKKIISKLDEIINRINPDVCFVSYPPSIEFDIGLIIKRRYPHIKLILDYRDGFISYSVEEEQLKNKYIREKYTALERNCVNMADAVITAVDVLSQDLKERYGLNNVYTITNGFDPDEFPYDPKEKCSFRRYTVLYTGGLDSSRIGQFAYAKPVLGELFREFETIDFVFVGKYKEYEKEFFAAFPNVKVMDRQSRNKVIAMQRSVDALLLVTSDDPSGTSGKLFEYLFAKKPIINLGRQNAAERIISETDSGLSFFNKEIDRIIEYVHMLQNGKAEFRYRSLDKFTRVNQAKQLAEIIHSLIND